MIQSCSCHTPQTPERKWSWIGRIKSFTSTFQRNPNPELSDDLHYAPLRTCRPKSTKPSSTPLDLLRGHSYLSFSSVRITSARSSFQLPPVFSSAHISRASIKFHRQTAG